MRCCTVLVRAVYCFGDKKMINVNVFERPHIIKKRKTNSLLQISTLFCVKKSGKSQLC